MKIFSILCIVVISLGAIAWMAATPSYSYSYRLTVEIDTPEGIKSGSSVIEVTTEKMPDWMSTLSSQETSVKSSPIYFSLPEGKNALILLYHGLWPKQNMIEVLFPRAALKPPCESMERFNWAREVSGMEARKIKLEPILIPNIVTFSDTNDPMSANFLYESGYDGACTAEKIIVVDTFSEILGDGYALKNATVVLTNESATKRKMGDVLPWWNDSEKLREFWMHISKTKTYEQR